MRPSQTMVWRPVQELALQQGMQGQPRLLVTLRMLISDTMSGSDASGQQEGSEQPQATGTLATP
jgi:hypothetical protein